MKWIQSLHFRLRRKSLLFDIISRRWSLHNWTPPLLLKNFCWKLCTVLSHLVTRYLPRLEKYVDIPGCQQDARCDVSWDRNGLGRLILEGWFVLRIPWWLWAWWSLAWTMPGVTRVIDRPIISMLELSALVVPMESFWIPGIQKHSHDCLMFKLHRSIWYPFGCLILNDCRHLECFSKVKYAVKKEEQQYVTMWFLGYLLSNGTYHDWNWLAAVHRSKDTVLWKTRSRVTTDSWMFYGSLAKWDG